MSQPRSFLMGEKNYPSQDIDTTFTKVFVGGLAWETQRETMSRYFEQFGEILEAVVVTEKHTGRSKGYGFVTFKDPEAALRACQNSSPVIDGRRTNCNLAYLGATKSTTRPSTPQHDGGRFRPATGPVAPPSYYRHSSSLIHQSSGQYIFPYSAYGNIYSGDSQDTRFQMNDYSNVYGGHQQFSTYYTGSGSIPSFYPYYAQYGQSSHTVQYPQIIQFPNYMPHHYHSAGFFSLPSSIAMTASTTATTPAPIATTAAGGAGVVFTAGVSLSQPSATVSDQENLST